MRAPVTARASLLAYTLLLVACGGHAIGASTGSVATSSGASTTAATATATTTPQRSPRAVSTADDWTRFGYDAQRSGVGPADTGITARNLGQLRKRVVQLDGTVDSSPIELHAVRVKGPTRDVIVVTTTYGRTIAIDAGTGRKLWEYVPPTIGAYEGSTQVTTATPVADPDRRYVYAASPDGRIRKLSIATGNEVRSGNWPATITFDPTHEKVASALNISGNNVIATTGGYYGDAPPYQGHVAMIDRASGRLLHVFNSLCSDTHRLLVPSNCGSSDSAIWARAGAVVEPDTGRLLVATGNGPFDGSINWGDSVLELTPDASGLLHNWTPVDQAQLSANDTDVGSTAPAFLGSYLGYRLAVQGGKDATLRLLNLNRLNGTRGGASPRTGGELQQIGTPGGAELLSAPAVWRHGGRIYLFVADDSGTAAYVLGGVSHPRLHVAWQDGTPGTSPIVAGGLLYVFDHNGGNLTIARPTTGKTLASLPAASGHWNSPIVVRGRIVIPVGNYMDHANSGTLYIYHLPGR